MLLVGPANPGSLKSRDQGVMAHFDGDQLPFIFMVQLEPVGRMVI